MLKKLLFNRYHIYDIIIHLSIIKELVFYFIFSPKINISLDYILKVATRSNVQELPWFSIIKWYYILLIY